MSQDFSPPAEIGALRTKAWTVAVVGLIACGAGFAVDRTQFFQSYLVAWVFWLGIALGCYAVALLHQLTRGGWGLMIRRILGAASRTIPWMALLSVPILVGLSEIYPWADPEHAATLPDFKRAFLTPKWFTIRTAAYFAMWLLPAFWLNRMSLKQDEVRSDKLFKKMQAFAAPALLGYALAATFASVDWLMSLDPHWYSSLFGISFIGGHGVSAFAFVIPIALWLGNREPLKGLVRPRHYHDYGKLLFAFVMLWAYFSVSQLIIVWSGNLPEEVTFYLQRIDGPWKWISILLAIGHFFLPFLVLLSRDVKRNAKRLAVVSILLLVMRWMDLWWTAAPWMAAAHGGGHGGGHGDAHAVAHGFPLHWLDLATLAAVGGIWLAVFFGQLASRPLLPVEEPYLKEELEDE